MLMMYFGVRSACVLAAILGFVSSSSFAQDGAKSVATLELQVQHDLQEQKPRQAIPVLREILSIDPKNLNALGNLGVLLFFEDSYQEAIPELRKALELQPNLWRIEALLGIAEKRTGDPASAETDLDRAFANLDEDKIRIEAGLELIELEAPAGQIDKALAVAQKLETIAPQNPQIQLVNYQIAAQLMDQNLLSMLMVSPDSAETHMVMAGTLARQGDHANAIAQYREAIRINSKLPGVHYELAEQLRMSTDPVLNAQAEGEFRAAVAANSYDERSWRGLGELLTQKGDAKTAQEDLRKALALQPHDSDAETDLAIVLISSNREDDAIPFLESAVKDDPTNAIAHYRLSIQYRRAGRTEAAERELAEFRHYKELREKLNKTFKQLAGRPNPL